MNKIAATEWLTKAWHHLSSGMVLHKADHYTDVIAVDIHYAIEIILKSFLAYENKKIIKSHDLIEIYQLIDSFINFDDDELDLLELVTTYHIKGSYPNPHRKMPSKEEIERVLEFAEVLFDRVCTILEIDKTKIING